MKSVCISISFVILAGIFTIMTPMGYAAAMVGEYQVAIRCGIMDIVTILFGFMLLSIDD